MNKLDFWDYVEELNWSGLCDDEERTGVNPCDEGKRRLLLWFPTLAEFKKFEVIYHNFEDDLYQALEEYGTKRFDDPDDDWEGFGLGDDSFGDLISHVVGCGKESYYATLADPTLAYNRELNRRLLRTDKSACRISESWVEKFSFCFPNDDDYDKPEVKLMKTEEALKYWAAEAAQHYDNPQHYAHNEVASLIAEIEKLIDLVNAQDSTPQITKPSKESIKRAVKDARIKILKQAFSDLATQKVDLLFRMKEIEEELHTLEE